MPAACPVQFFRLQMDGDGVLAAAKSERYAIVCPLIGEMSDKSVFGNFSFYSYKKACGQKKTVRGSKNSRRLSNDTPAI